ncbi:hypothetical protein JTB14_034332 [Gonioctena quinquepunctata]|nr:hypothetical protein JTB14_034332 [Gonioctena quinquepunctata]
MASKRKRVVLSLADKLKIIEQLDKGVTGKKLSEIYGVGKATISDIKNSPILCEKAKILAEKLGYSSFKASNGWLRNFKFRHGVRELDLAGEKLSADSAAAENFIEKFKTASESYDPEFVYNADETGLVWKALPKTTLASKRESSAPGHKAWMTAALFTEWYDEVFIPEVKKHQKSVGKEGSKVLLIVDNAPTHPTAELLERENGQFKTTFLPPNVTSLLQPMDQSVIETMKRHYRRQLLRKLLIEGAEDEELVLENHSKINLKDCCYMVAEAWSLVTAVTLRRAWNKLKGLPSEKNKKKESEENEKQEYGEDDDDEDALSLEEIRKMIVKIPGCTEVSAEDVGEWMACDTSDPGFQILNDDEIVVSVREDVEVEVEEELSADVEVDAGPSASEAFAGLETALKWMERQPECDHLQLLTVKRMRDLAARKRLKTAKQLTLTEMFKKQ